MIELRDKTGAVTIGKSKNANTKVNIFDFYNKNMWIKKLINLVEKIHSKQN